MTKDELTKLIYDNELLHGTIGIGIVMDMSHIEKFANLVAEAEREACWKTAEAIVPRHTECGNRIAAAIRARSQ